MNHFPEVGVEGVYVVEDLDFLLPVEILQNKVLVSTENKKFQLGIKSPGGYLVGEGQRVVPGPDFFDIIEPQVEVQSSGFVQNEYYFVNVVEEARVFEIFYGVEDVLDELIWATLKHCLQNAHHDLLIMYLIQILEIKLFQNRPFDLENKQKGFPWQEASDIKITK